jgi:phosphate starvation-inducible protein PhoH and related proteins
MLGSAERNLKIIRETLGVNITARNGTLRLSGQSHSVGQAAQVLEQLLAAAKKGRPMDREQLLNVVLAGGESSRSRPEAAAPVSDGFDVYAGGRRITAMTAGQRHYLSAMANHDLTVCVGPAGTGKTYLAVAAAVSMLKRGSVRKLVLVRPAVEAGEKLGFLPGSMQEKVNPYLRPLLDALHDMIDFEQIQRFMACDLIEIIPLAFMRGRTLNDSMVILDEAQNTTRAQMLMFLTRLGHGSKMIVTGDTSQIDLEDPRQSGLIDAARRLRRVPGVALVALAQSDIVRHSLVQRIVDAYGQDRPPRPPVFDDPPLADELTEPHAGQ